VATRLDIRTRARIRADQDASTFPTDTQYNYLIDEAARDVWMDLIQAGWPVKPSSVNLSVSSQYTALGVSNVAFITGVFYDQGGAWVELSRVPEGSRAALMASSGGEAGYYQALVTTTGLQLELLPPTSGTYRVEYVPEFTGFAGDATEWHGPLRSDELVVLAAAAKGCRKEGNDQGAAALDREYLLLREKVQNMASWVNARHSATIRDVGNPLRPGRMPFDYNVDGDW
jgi:hypothetical protein